MPIFSRWDSYLFLSRPRWPPVVIKILDEYFAIHNNTDYSILKHFLRVWPCEFKFKSQTVDAGTLGAWSTQAQGN